MLRVEHIDVSYGNFKALYDVSLEINPGEIVALLGSNGAGKSTTINTISGMTKVNAGKLYFNDTCINNMPPYERVKLGIIQVPEGRKLFPFMTVEDNLLVGSYLKSVHDKRSDTLSLCYEMFPKLYERRKQMAGSMSGGEQQMCAIARGLMQQPKLLMLDEPSLGLAPVIVEQIFEVLQKINQMGTTILLVEQNVMSSLEIASRGYVLEIGRNVMEGTSQELLSNEELKKAYLGL